MKSKLFKKFYYTTSLILLVTLTLVFVILSFALNNAISKNTFDKLSKSCDVISGYAFYCTDISEFKNDILNLSDAIEEINDLDVFVTDTNGKIVICGCSDYSINSFCEHTDTVVNKSILNKISNKNLLELTTLNDRFSNPRYVYATKIKIGTDSAFVFLSSDTVSTGELLKMLFGIYAVAAIIPLLFMFFAEYNLTYRLAKPLKYMSEAARSIAKGDFSKRIPVMSNDEIGELSVLFNKMTDSLARNELTHRSFVANISHELKTPMTTISGFIDGIVDGTIKDDKREYYLEIISNEVKRLSRLVETMLNISKLESDSNNLKTTKFDFANIVLNVALSMENKINDKNIEVLGFDTISNIEISADEDMIHSLVYNLIDNAVKYTEADGTIFFSICSINDMLEFRIRNSGKGIPKEDLPNIFDRFYKVDKSRSYNKESLGLGLYICKTIATIHGGTISVDTKENEYTEFTVTLPINITEESNGK